MSGARTLTLDEALAFAIQLHQQGQLADAEQLYRQILAVAPNNPSALHLLGLIQRQSGRLDEAERLVRASVAAHPGYAEAHNNLGNILRDEGRAEEAVACHRAALALNSRDEESHYSLGLTFQALGRTEEAAASYRAALALRPDYLLALNNLGNALQEAGNSGEALDCFERALALAPDFAEAHYNLARLLQAQGRPEEAVRHYAEAVRLRPDLAPAHYNLGLLFRDLNRPDEAEASYRQALELAPGETDAANNLAILLKDQGRVDEAVEVYRAALAIRPDDAEMASNYLLALNYAAGVSAEKIFREHRAFARRFEQALRPLWLEHANIPDPERPLRVGYVSADFRRHAAANFIEPVWACRDKSRFHLIAYSNHAQPDGVTARLKALADDWRDIAGLSDQAVADLILQDRVDILVDLSGHTAGNRLGVFARRPAPVQATWLGYLNTTGLEAMDYRISDAYADPPGAADALHSERLVRLPASQWCYRPFAEAAVTPLPARVSGTVTFGSFNNLAKLTPPVIDLWARLLAALPAARLSLAAVPQGKARERLGERFAVHGVETSRLTFLDRLPAERYWELFFGVDIALDPFPYNGGTTTCDALWMGLPVVTLAGERSVSRSGASLLATLGHPEWVARSPDDYVAIATALAGDVAKLAELRSGLRQRMQASPLMDEAGFTAALENAYRRMWRDWCGRAK